MNSGDVACERRWYYFLTSSVAPYFGVLGFLLLVRLMYVRRQRLTGRAVTLRSAIIARHVVSLKSPVGKVLVSVYTPKRRGFRKGFVCRLQLV